MLPAVLLVCTFVLLCEYTKHSFFSNRSTYLGLWLYILKMENTSITLISKTATAPIRNIMDSTLSHCVRLECPNLCQKGKTEAGSCWAQSVAWGKTSATIVGEKCGIQENLAKIYTCRIMELVYMRKWFLSTSVACP